MDSLDPYPDRRAHWIRFNHTERMPHRWIVADTEAIQRQVPKGEEQTLRCVDAVRWRTDLKTGDHAEDWAGESAADFWAWVDDYCKSGARTVLWFHNVAYDVRTLDMFGQLPRLGFELDWCNLDRDVSVATWRSDHGTLVIADTWTWLAKPLADVSGMVGIGKPRLPKDDDSLAAWHARCRADVDITAAAVRELLAFVRSEHLGNWQPSGAGMGYAAWRHRFLQFKVLVHDDAPAIAAERVAMHAGRAEAWHHGPAKGGPFDEWDMHMAYCRIAAECALPARLYAYDGKPTDRVHQWAKQHWTVLCRVKVHTDQPVVPCKHDDRTIWPVGDFETTLWQPELELIERTGGQYEVLEQWRYVSLPILKEWAEWSMAMCDPKNPAVTPVQAAFVKHQSRALIGRLALRNASWTEWGANPFGWCGLTDMVDADTGDVTRMMHVGGKTFAETDRRESQSSLPQVTGYIMAMSRVRLWDAAAAAGVANVVHVDTDSLIVNRAGSVALEYATRAALPGGWRKKEHWSRIDVTGPRHYRSTGRRVIPGVPRSAVETEPGRFDGQVWESVATALERGVSDTVRLVDRTWRPNRFDGRRPWTIEGPAQPIRLPAERTEGAPDVTARGQPMADHRREHGDSGRRAPGRTGAGDANRSSRRSISRGQGGKQAQPRTADSGSRNSASGRDQRPTAATTAARTSGTTRRGKRLDDGNTERTTAGPGRAHLSGDALRQAG